MPAVRRRALVTGGASGIGEAIVRHLAADGLHVVCADLQAEAAARVAVQAGATAVHLDACDFDAVHAAVALHGPFDILINCVGVDQHAFFTQTGPQDWRRLLAVNLETVLNATHAVLPAMQQAGWGRIVNIASTAGQRGYGYVAAYAAAKHGVVGFTRSLAIEVATSGITVNAVCPGFTETDMLARSVANIVEKTGRSEAEARAQLAALNPQRRFVTPQDVAASVAWLCSDGAAAMTGQAISVSGGEVM